MKVTLSTPPVDGIVIVQGVARWVDDALQPCEACEFYGEGLSGSCHNGKPLVEFLTPCPIDFQGGCGGDGIESGLIPSPVARYKSECKRCGGSGLVSHGQFTVIGSGRCDDDKYAVHVEPVTP